ncbi:MAG: GDP-mannose 4,6-dehydratase [Candidatus Omnitrophica bacterium]|nr:GDP-mannose 4,6-dehydratase [Candidatus Omnitrophota bacterium]
MADKSKEGFWKDKRVLVTGAGGFIGSHLAERLVELGAKTRAFVHYRADGSWGWLNNSPWKDRMEVLAGDICDRDSVFQAVEGMEIVFHLAALIAIPYSYHAPYSYYRTNVEGTLHLLQAARACRPHRIIHTSTSEVYGTAQYCPINEGHPLQTQSPYAASKCGADKLVEAFFHSYELPVVTVRPFNTFGPRQSSRAIVPAIITQCLTRETIRLGNLHPTRDLNFVEDIVEGFLCAAIAEKAVGWTVNLGTGREISIQTLAEKIAELTSHSIALEQDSKRVRPQHSEVERLVADNSLARQLLGWAPKIRLEEGLKVTIDWTREHLDGYRPGVYVL